MYRVKTIITLLALCIIVALTAGCTTTYQTRDLIAPTKLNRGANIYIARAQDGSYGNTVYKGSGLIATSLLHAAIAPYSKNVIIGNQWEDLNQATISAIASNCRYLMMPVLTNWEPRVAAWSGRPTRVSINIAVYDLDSGGSEQIINKSLDVTGRSATLVNQQPEDILAHLLERFVQEAF